VHVQVLQGNIRRRAQRGVVVDISQGGLLLRFTEPLVDCDRVVMMSAGLKLVYKICHSYEQDEFFFAGVEAVHEV
jgi:hypothetical protein